MAGDAVDQLGSLPAAEVERQRATRIERAAGRRIDRVGNLALDRNALAAATSRDPARRRAASWCRACADRANSSRPSAISTMRPRYITPTRLAMWRTTARLWLMKQIGQAELVLQVAHQVEDLRLHRNVERRGRLVADDELGFEAQRRARSRCAAAGRRKTRADISSRRRGARPTSSSSSPTRAWIVALALRSGRRRGSARRRWRRRASAG